MHNRPALKEFLRLVKLVSEGGTGRSENDLSSRLAAALSELGLSTVVDTSVALQKRPDILGYVHSIDADLVLPAEIVIEAKRPEEVRQHRSLADAIVSDEYWETKTFPYISGNLSRIQYFVLTTFAEFGIVQITERIRAGFREAIKKKDNKCIELRKRIRKNVTLFQLRPQLAESDARSTQNWLSWVNDHFNPSVLSPIPPSEILNSVPVETRSNLEHFAARLAEFAAGLSDSGSPNCGLFHSIRSSIPNAYSELTPAIKRNVHIFLMTQHPGSSHDTIQKIATEHAEESLDDFVAASIHSLLGRLFAIKAIEDGYCVNSREPLIEEEYWVFNFRVYDEMTAEEILPEVFERLWGIRKSKNEVIQKFAAYGFFFDWIRDHIDAIVFRSLFEIFIVHDFQNIEGDVLGRFFELYSQRVNKSRRKSLGQYYTPLPIVEFMLFLSMRLVRQRSSMKTLNVIDPAMGSGTFLAEIAKTMDVREAGDFWHRLVGFDISSQVIGISYVNVYMAILSQITRKNAAAVDDLKLYITDALDPRNGQYLKQILPLLSDREHKEFLENRIEVSTELKKAKNYYLVIGNPPYRNNSSATLRQMAQRFPTLLASSDATARAQTRNIRDDYAWFLAAADYYVKDKGLICFIVSDSFAHLKSYKAFRESVIQHYHIRYLLRLGSHIFSDVGPRMSFAIILLEKREEKLLSAEQSEGLNYCDLRMVIEQVAIDTLGTEDDPRFRLLRSVARNEKSLPNTVIHCPSSDNSFCLYPQGSIVERVRQGAIPTHGVQSQRIFIRKWPGIITAFDSLFRCNSHPQLKDRISKLFQISNQRILTNRQLFSRLEDLGKSEEFNESEIERLIGLSTQIRQLRLSFNDESIKRSFGGALSNDVKWYPPASSLFYLYYEPRLHIPRNVNEGKQVGWGSMEQWRDPESHLIQPKLVYTTASKPQYGYKAFVLSDNWYVKLHGGTSQQYNYTGIQDPSNSDLLLGAASNLADGGLMLAHILEEQGLTPEDLLHYIAAIYNSELAQELLEEGGSSADLHIKVPDTQQKKTICKELICLAERLRDLFQLKFKIESESRHDLSESEIGKICNEELLSELGMKRVTRSNRRFKNEIASLVSG
jgi:hypothetical protein